MEIPFCSQLETDLRPRGSIRQFASSLDPRCAPCLQGSGPPGLPAFPTVPHPLTHYTRYPDREERVYPATPSEGKSRWYHIGGFSQNGIRRLNHDNFSSCACPSSRHPNRISLIGDTISSGLTWQASEETLFRWSLSRIALNSPSQHTHELPECHNMQPLCDTPIPTQPTDTTPAQT